MKKLGYAWGCLGILTMVAGFKLFVLGITGSEMIRGLFSLLIAGYSLARSTHFLGEKEDK